MKILDLPLKAVWYLMIESGEKTKEYREIKDFWKTRFKCSALSPNPKSCESCPFGGCASFTHVRFRYGYTKRTMLFRLDSISIGKGRPEWGAPDNDVFVLKLGERIYKE